MAQWLRIRLPMQEMLVQSLSGEDPLEKKMAAHSSILPWRIPWTEDLPDPGIEPMSAVTLGGFLAC